MAVVNLIVTPSDPKAMDAIAAELEREVPVRFEDGSVIGRFEFEGEVTDEQLDELEAAWSDIMGNLGVGVVTVDARRVSRKKKDKLSPFVVIGGAAALVGLAVFFGMRRREQQPAVQGADALHALEAECASCQAARAA